MKRLHPFLTQVIAVLIFAVAMLSFNASATNHPIKNFTIMENMTILQLQEAFKDKLQVSKRPELTMNKMVRYHSEHLKGTRSVFVKFYEDYNYARSMDNYPDLKMFTGCFNLIECIYYIDVEHSVKEEE